jgi:toxin ParE1/3/4
LRVVWNQQAIDDRIEMMARRTDYVSVASAFEHDDQIEAKGEALAGVVTYKRGRIKGTREYVFSDQYIMVYRIDGDVVEILSIVPTAMNWANSARKIKPLI